MSNTVTSTAESGQIAPIDDRPHFVYRLYDTEGALLYVGCTVDIRQRMLDLAHRKSWFQNLGAARAVKYPNKAAGLAAERTAIETEGPRHNGTHNPVTANPGDWPISRATPHSTVLKPEGARKASRLVEDVMALFAKSECDEHPLIVVPAESDDLADLRARFVKAVATLDTMARDTDGEEAARLRGKADGVRLAMSYLDETVRLQRPAVTR